ncbi:MAG: hypothetical protein J6K97_03685, partial [Clostridia bacterium]|nr:hypothetical protein [Clostridia bacterium]
MNKERSARSTKCESCGDDMIFSPEKGDLVCFSCGKIK